jgi:hypothetical protein
MHYAGAVRSNPATMPPRPCALAIGHDSGKGAELVRAHEVDGIEAA